MILRAILTSFFLGKTGNTAQRATGKRKIRVFIDRLLIEPFIIYQAFIEHLSSIYRAFSGGHLPQQRLLNWAKSYPEILPTKFNQVSTSPSKLP